MAYMNQERKAKFAPVIKEILKKYGMKGSLAVDNYSTLVLNIKSGPIDFWADMRHNPFSGSLADRHDRGHMSVNVYWVDEQNHLKSNNASVATVLAESADEKVSMMRVNAS